MKTVAIQVYGLVQGVGFRYMTKQLADSLGVKGIVMNRRDGSVYIEAQAKPMILQEFISKVKLSPSPSGRVDDYQIEEINHSIYPDFKVTYE
ncbi:MAG TPA: acylphosphatase [Candidatus Ligilactobacillus excrementigallinarum]|uniref:acylphosphatase n=1 Tax=Candidatus Ligilactobacillus excrementigallinarum TaxID=2838641 RepID=A0A9D2A983_9LACO|nr:acylphosphatase [Candidatus Ligilactobacillus excrementigallinarum]